MLAGLASSPQPHSPAVPKAPSRLAADSYVSRATEQARADTELLIQPHRMDRQTTHAPLLPGRRGAASIPPETRGATIQGNGAEGGADGPTPADPAGPGLIWSPLQQMHLRLEFIRSTNRGGGDCTHHERFRPARTRPTAERDRQQLEDGKFGEESADAGRPPYRQKGFGLCSQLAGEVVYLEWNLLFSLRGGAWPGGFP